MVLRLETLQFEEIIDRAYTAVCMEKIKSVITISKPEMESQRTWKQQMDEYKDENDKLKVHLNQSLYFTPPQSPQVVQSPFYTAPPQISLKCSQCHTTTHSLNN